MAAIKLVFVSIVGTDIMLADVETSGIDFAGVVVCNTIPTDGIIPNAILSLDVAE